MSRKSAPGKRKASLLSHRDYLVNRASDLVYTEIIEGRLAHPSECICVDCGLSATCYDHRDYNKPLDVVPVCQGCNVRRGPGLPLPGEDDGRQTKLFWFKDKSKNKGWNDLGGGEGYSPLEFICHADLPEERPIGFDLGINLISALDSYKVANAMSSAANTGKSNYSKDHWYMRAAYFKEHDPWFA